jgi:hypothetical protein
VCACARDSNIKEEFRFFLEIWDEIERKRRTIMARKVYDADYDFIGFTYNGKHSIDDFGIYRTSDGSRYNHNLIPQLNDKTADVPGGHGQYYFNSTYKNR